VQSYGLPECIEQVVTRSKWNERKGKLPPGRGLGIACSHYVSGAANSIIRSDMPHSTVNIKIDRDGGVVIYTGASDIGQGSDTMVAQIVAEVLGIGNEPDQSNRRRYRPYADRHWVLLQPRNFHERQRITASAEDVKKKIVAAAAKKMNCAPEDVIMRDDRVWKRGTEAPTPMVAELNRARRMRNHRR